MSVPSAISLDLNESVRTRLDAAFEAMSAERNEDVRGQMVVVIQESVGTGAGTGRAP